MITLLIMLIAVAALVAIIATIAIIFASCWWLIPIVAIDIGAIWLICKGIKSCFTKKNKKK